MTMKHNEPNEENNRQVPENTPESPQMPTAAADTQTAPAEPLTPAPQEAPLMDAEGSFTPEWYRRFEELEPYAATLSKFHRPEALAKSYAHLERLKGYPDPADARRMEAFRCAVGLPDSADSFVLIRPENTPDELWDPELAAGLAGVAYEYGVPPKAMEALAARYAAEGRRHLEKLQQQQQEALQQADSQLQEQWGQHYEDNLRTVSSFIRTMGERAGVDTEELLQDPALRANADFARLMLEAASLMQEAPLRMGLPSDDRREAHRIAHDPTHPLHEAYMRTSHPQHRYANEQYDRLAFGRKLHS